MSDPTANIARALAPYIEAAVNAAVTESAERAVQATPLPGVLESVAGPTGYVSVAGQDELVAGTMVGTSLVAGDTVVVVFYGHGTAYIHGPIPGPAAPV